MKYLQVIPHQQLLHYNPALGIQLRIGSEGGGDAYCKGILASKALDTIGIMGDKTSIWTRGCA